MNTAATHLVTNVVAWVEHEEIIVVSELKKTLVFIENNIELFAILGIIGSFSAAAIVRLIQINECYQIISGYF